jgi:acetoacetate decarboxylase
MSTAQINSPISFVVGKDEREANEVHTVVFDDAEMLVCAWETDPQAIAAALPPPLQPAADPVVLVFVSHFKSTNYNPPYHEAGLFVRCLHEGVEGGYCISMLLDDDIAMMIGREMHGYPKKMAALRLDRVGERIEASIVRRGKDVFRAVADLAPDACDPFPVLARLGGPTYTFRFTPAVEGRGMDGPARLIGSTAAAEPSLIEPAQVSIIMEPSAFDPWASFPVERVIGAAFVRGNVIVPRDGGSVLASVAPEEFAPFAYAGWDRPFHNFNPD